MDKTKTTSQMPLGTWGKLSTDDTERLPKIDFDVNKPVVVEFLDEEPREYTGQDGGAFYVFNIRTEGIDKVISTSAWTLLRGLKALAPLKGKKIQIEKKLVKGKQGFLVTELKG